MTLNDQIQGFRQDRIGARMICLLNVMRLQEKFGAKGRFLWLSQPDGPYPELSDPLDFLAPEVVEAHIQVVSDIPDKAGRENIRALAPGISRAQFIQQLARGRRYECDSMAEVIRFLDESPVEVARQVRRIAAGLALSKPMVEALAHAREVVAKAGGGRPLAIHVRRGDILDGIPWSYSCWPSKYVPDEFFRAFMQTNEGPVIAFSDTPAAVTHLAQGDPRIVPVAGLFEDAGLSVAQRDLLELLLMGQCARVGAPSQSAFSQAASVVGGARIVGLPAMLPPVIKQAANDALLDRVVSVQDSFFAPGDLAQSVSYAATHSVNTDRASELVDAFDGQKALLERFPFLYRELAVAALGASRKEKARKLARQGLKSELMRNRDKPQCRQVLMVLGENSVDGAKSEPVANAVGQPDMDAQFLTLCFTGRAAEGPIVPALAHRLLSQGGKASEALMFDPVLTASYSRAGVEVLAADQGGGDAGLILPLWTLRSEWSELITDARVRNDLLGLPILERKLAPAAEALAVVEAALDRNSQPAITDEADLIRLGFCATQLRLHGRLKRAFALLHWLDEIRPGQAMTHKRLADGCFAAGNVKAGERWLNSAIALAPDNALLHLSAATRAAEAGRPRACASGLTRAEAAWPSLDLVLTLGKRLKKILREATQNNDAVKLPANQA